MRRLLLATVCCLLLGCSRDATITGGADGSPEWERKLRGVVPLGTSVVETRAIMSRNGFHCEPATDPVPMLWCKKEAEDALGLGRRRWQATFLIRKGRVDGVQSSTQRVNR